MLFLPLPNYTMSNPTTSSAEECLDEYGIPISCLDCGTYENVQYYESCDRAYFIGDSKAFPRCPSCFYKREKLGRRNLRRNS